VAQWTFRNAGGNLYLATTTVAGTATSSMSALSIIGSNGKVGIATTTPWQTFSVVGTGAWNGLTAAASGNVSVCINATTKLLYEGSSATTCTPSSIRYKNNIKDSDAGLTKLMQLRPVTFYFNDRGDPTEQVGFIAEEVFAVDTRLIQLDRKGLPNALRLDSFLPVIVKSIQELNSNLESIASTSASVTLVSASFAESFFSNLFARITTWLADSGNGIAQVFAKEVYTNKLCVKKSDGSDVCITGDELALLLAGERASSPSPTPPPPPTSEPDPEPEPESESEPTATSTEPVIIPPVEEPTEPEPDPTSSSDSTGSLQADPEQSSSPQTVQEEVIEESTSEPEPTTTEPAPN
jgi:hypothetical protein